MCADQINASNSPAEKEYGRITRWWGPGWLVICIIYSASMVYSILHNHPGYLHDWHAAAIILLSSAILVIYGFGILLSWNHKWPLPLRYTLSMWLCLYATTVALTLVNHDFAYDLYIIFGITFALFYGRILFLFVTILFISFCITQNLFIWPFDLGSVGTIMGVAMSFFSTTLLGAGLQSAIAQRNQRMKLLQELTHANAELEAAHQQLVEAGAQQQELAVLRERTRLAREVHDTLGHALVLVSVKLEVAQRLHMRDPERSERELEETKGIVRESMKDLRASIANLRSPALEREPACRAISRYARVMAQRANVQVTYDLHPDIEGLPEQVEETLWKVGQEALTNIEKHASASNVVLHISRRNSRVYMKIQDDGVGIPQELCHLWADGSCVYESPEGHYGLNGMLERVAQVDGQFHLSRDQQQGTIVEVEIPLVEAPC